MTFSSRLAAVFFSICWVPVAQAKTQVFELAVFSGKVLVNHGQGFVADTVAVPGDFILLGDQAAASLLYPQGCFVALPAAEVFQVPAQVPCRGGETVGAAGADFAVPAASSGGSMGIRHITNNPGPAVAVAAAIVTGAAASLPVWRVNGGPAPASAP